MLQINVLYTKPYFQRPDGERLVDLTRSSFNYSSHPNAVDKVVVTRDFVMRPDLISQTVYGNPNNLDYILKFNGISNPYSLDLGDELYIPDVDEMEDSLVRPTMDEDSKDLKELPKRRSESDKKQARKKRNDIVNKKKQSEELAKLPPNVAKKPNVTFEDGKIVFGGNVTGANAAKCPENQSVTKLKEKLLNNKIYGR